MLLIILAELKVLKDDSAKLKAKRTHFFSGYLESNVHTTESHGGTKPPFNSQSQLASHVSGCL